MNNMDDFGDISSFENNPGEQNLIRWTIRLMYEFKMSYKDILELPTNVFSEMVKFLQEIYNKNKK